MIALRAPRELNRGPRRVFQNGTAAALALILSCLYARSARAADSPKTTPFQQHAALFLMKCAKCHTIGGGPRVGPDLRGVADRRDKEWILGFIMNPDAYLDKDPTAKALLAEHNGVRMENTHLSREQAEGLFEFLKAASSAPESAGPEEAPPPEEPLYQRLRMPDEGIGVSVPGVSLLLLIVAAAVVAWRFGFRSAAGFLLVAGVIAAYWAFGGRRYYRLLGSQQGYAPAQPIPFSHALHAGQLGISCFYCHSGAEHSDVAGVPSVNTCMNCHAAVRSRSGQKEPSPEIARLLRAWAERGDPSAHSVEWIRVHHLPDYVHFSHRAHVADNIQCQECHGPVQKMDRMRQASSLSMGWCISCHRMSPREAPSHWKRTKGPLDCAACHW